MHETLRPFRRAGGASDPRGHRHRQPAGAQRHAAAHRAPPAAALHQLVPQRQWHTLVTSGFIHADLAHLLFQPFSFWPGFDLERAGRRFSGAALPSACFASSFRLPGAIHPHRATPNLLVLQGRSSRWCSRRSSATQAPRCSSCRFRSDSGTLFAVGYLAYSDVLAGRSGIGRINHDARGGRGGRAGVHGAGRAGSLGRAGRHLAQLSACCCRYWIVSRRCAWSCGRWKNAICRRRWRSTAMCRR